MQITGIRQTHLSHVADGPFYPTWIPGYPQGIHEVELFEIATDAGITGITASPSFAGGFDYANPLETFLIGHDPHDVRGFRRKLSTVDLIGPRPWHLEVALWDIIGKDAGKPLYEILGGSDDPIPAYASSGEVQAVDARIEYVQNRIDEGFSAVKLRVTELDDLQIVREVRETFPDLTLMVDANKGWSVRVMEDEECWTYKDAVQCGRELETIGDIAWLEEPLPKHDYDGYTRLRQAIDIPVAGGEFNDGFHELREFVDRNAVDILQPDTMLVTGVRGAIEAARMADSRGIDYIPHTWTNGIGLAANLHVMAAVDSPWCEFPLEPPWTTAVRDFMLQEPLTVDDGAITPPDGPGLGVNLDPDTLDTAS